MKGGLRNLAVAVVLAVSAFYGAELKASEIKVLSSNGVHSVMVELIPAFERATGHKVSIDYYTSNQVLERVKQGQRADAVIITRGGIEGLIGQGKVVKGSARDLGSSGVGVAIAPGLPKPDISTTGALKAALLAAESIAFTKTGASGIHFANVLEKLGIAAEVHAKAKVPAGGAVGPLVARGEAQMAVQQIPELLAVPGIQFVGPLPPELQFSTIFTAGIMSDSREPEAVKALFDFLTTAEARRLMKEKGFESGP